VINELEGGSGYFLKAGYCEGDNKVSGYIQQLTDYKNQQKQF
jgi:hypothetical protein